VNSGAGNSTARIRSRSQATGAYQRPVVCEETVVASDFPALERAYHHAVDYLSGLDGRSVATTRGLTELREALSKPLAARGAPPEVIIDDLVRATEGGQLGVASGRFFGWVMGGALPSALAADWLASTWDVNACI
jgi:hypothetical protein